MLVYPQILTGGLAQYPLAKTRRVRNAGVRTMGGAWLTRHDAGAGEVEWVLNYEGLRQAEAMRLQEFFDEAEGQLRRFTFVDPMANLLLWSGDLTQAVWEKGQVAAARTAEGWMVTNGSAGAQGVGQTVNAPGEYRYALSVWLKGAAGTRVYLKIGGAVEEKVMTGYWRREQMTAAPGTGMGVRFGIEMEAGATVEMHGPQAEAQRAASAYKPGTGLRTVHEGARFAMDELDWVVEGPEQFSTRVWIRTRGEE